MPDYIISTNLQKHIDAIKKADGSAKRAIFEIAYRLAEIADEQSGLLDNSGYSNVTEFAADQFGYAKSTTLNYIKIANRYLTGTINEIRTICADLDDGGKAVKDYKVGQLNALPGNVDRDEFRRLDAAGIINKDMSADKIKKALKDFYNPEEPEPDQTDNNVPCITISLQQLFLNIVTPIIDDFCTITDTEPDTAQEIFREFFPVSSGYMLSWVTDPEDGEIIGAALNQNGECLYSTNTEV